MPTYVTNTFTDDFSYTDGSELPAPWVSLVPEDALNTRYDVIGGHLRAYGDASFPMTDRRPRSLEFDIVDSNTDQWQVCFMFQRPFFTVSPGEIDIRIYSDRLGLYPYIYSDFEDRPWSSGPFGTAAGTHWLISTDHLSGDFAVYVDGVQQVQLNLYDLRYLDGTTAVTTMSCTYQFLYGYNYRSSPYVDGDPFVSYDNVKIVYDDVYPDLDDKLRERRVEFT